MFEEKPQERSEVEKGQLVMPFYLVCDVSLSMTRDMPTLNDGLQRLHQAIRGEPTVDDVAQVSILTFSDTAKVVLPMGVMSEVPVPTLSVEQGTNYGEAFRVLAKAVEQDNARLKAQGYQVFRPCAFFLTDGEPLDDDWRQSFESNLTYDQQARRGMKGHPIFVPFGFRSAPENVLKQLAYPPDKAKWYHAKNSSVEEALKGILDIIMKTMVTAGLSAGAGAPMLAQQPPAPGSQITQGDSEYDPWRV